MFGGITTFGSPEVMDVIARQQAIADKLHGDACAKSKFARFQKVKLDYCNSEVYPFMLRRNDGNNIKARIEYNKYLGAVFTIAEFEELYDDDMTSKILCCSLEWQVEDAYFLECFPERLLIPA